MKKTFVRLSDSQINYKLNFIHNYIDAKNAATASMLDANANVSSKNLSTLSAELNKDINIQVNRHLLCERIKELFGEDLSKEYLRQLEAHEIYTHDETSILPYCVSITMFPFLTDGLTKLGGESKAPKHLNSFCGSFVNLVFAISSQFAGAIATVEFLMYFDHFAKKDYGDDYLNTHTDLIKNHLQHVVYAINQPAAARGYQASFWNISVFDEHYFNSIFGEFVFPDFTKPTYDSVNKLQEFFMTWFNNERTKSILTFPVVTAAMLIENEEPKDKHFADFISTELSNGNSFFIYQSESADSLSSCCRLRNEFTDNTFSYSLGAGGVSTGSINVMTLNINRIVQQNKDLKEEVEKIQKYQVAYRSLIEHYIENNMLPVYKAGFISIDKQFLTIGINGMVEAAESKGIQATYNIDYINFIQEKLKIIYDSNKEAKVKYGCMFNTEFVPAENLGVKNAEWDKLDGLFSPRECYNSYFFPVENQDLNVIDKFQLHGKDFVVYLDGGSALHLNLETYPSKESFRLLLNVAARTGCHYFCFNTKITICNDCGYIDKKTNQFCSKCGSKNIDHATRVIGYLKRISSFSQSRIQEESLRYYH